MSRLGKRAKWERNKTLERVYEPALRVPSTEPHPWRGRWAQEVFGNPEPIHLELGCGKGTFTVELGRTLPSRNFIGVDLKGHRFWTGAQMAEDLGLENVAYLRIQIQMIERVFAPGEVGDIWLTFSDPQPKDGKGKKRITSALFVERYRRLCRPGSQIHIKTDSDLVYDSALEELGPKFDWQERDIHSGFLDQVPEPLRTLLTFQTPYEARWIAEGRKIGYLALTV